MKSKLIPVVFTAALTSLTTMYLAARYHERTPFFTASDSRQAPVNHVSYAANTGGLKGTPPADFQLAAEGSIKAVVHIKTQTKARSVIADNAYGDDYFSQLFGQREYYIPKQMGSGSGVVISPDGYIVTNNHVIAGTDQVTVTFNDRYTTQARVVAVDASTDVAVLKVEEKNLPYMEFGNSDDVRIGQWVLAAGYPLSLDATVTAGIVSAKGRTIGINRTNSATPVESFIQTDAAVNPGNSGGALVNTDGQLIGINSAIASPTGSYAGYSYAIPSNIVRKVVNDLMQYGSVQRGYLGIQLLDLKRVTPEQLSQLGIDRNDGVYVEAIIPGSGAAGSDLQKGDFITRINDVDIHTEPQLFEQIARYKPGDNISVTYNRDGAVKVTTIQLKNSQGNTKIIKQSEVSRALGANFRALTADEAKKLNIYGGVLVTEIGSGSLSKQTNMRKGFIITSVNEQPVKSIEELQTKLAAKSTKVQIAGVYPGRNGVFYYGLSDINLADGAQ